jgi:hypothetical protein
MRWIYEGCRDEVENWGGEKLVKMRVIIDNSSYCSTVLMEGIVVVNLFAVWMHSLVIM